MSDLSLPLLLPAMHEPQATPAAAAFAWPMPDVLGLAESAAHLAKDPAPACEIEGLNGHTTVGRLSLFDPERSLLQMRLPTSRAAVVLRFSPGGPCLAWSGPAHR